MACNDDAVGTYASVTHYVSSFTSYWVEIVAKEPPTFSGQLTLEVDLVSEEISGLYGAYFNNIDLEGDPTATRQDSTVNFDWGPGSPLPEIDPNMFSVRWIASVEPEFSETYTFHTLSDDGVRLWVDGELLIDNWTDHDPTWVSGTIPLQAGEKYALRLEYYEHVDDASIRLEWSSTSTTQEIIPSTQFTTLDLGGSTVEAGPVQVVGADQTSTITVTTMNGEGEPDPISDQQIFLQISG